MSCVAIALFLAPIAGIGCSSGVMVGPYETRCRQLCEASKACPDFSGHNFSCYNSCDDLEALNKANECYDEAESFYSCIEKYGVCSDLDTLCIDEQDVYSDCLADPCSLDPDRDICA